MNDLSILTKDGKLDYSKMGEIPTLPNALGFENFIQAFRNSPNARLTKSQNNVYYNTPAGEIKIYLPRAHGHFFKNGIYGNGKQDRGELTGALMQILDKPLFITKDRQDKLYFYKPFRIRTTNTADEFLDLISVSVDKNGRMEYRTTYEDMYNQVLDMINGYEVVYKARLE